MTNYFGYTFLWLLGFVVDRLDGSTGDCPVDFTNYDPLTGTCLYLSGDTKTWYKAREQCVSYGADLVRVTSQTAADACKKLIETSPHAVYWIGLNDILRDQNYRWTNGDPMIWDNFGTADGHQQPNDHRQNQNCNIGDVGSGMLEPNTWQDKPCNKMMAYICEYKPGDKTIKTGNYRLRQESIYTLINVELTSTNQRKHGPVCGIECLKEPICDGYAFNKDTHTCSLLKLKETSSSERGVVQSELTGSHVYIRNG